MPLSIETQEPELPGVFFDKLVWTVEDAAKALHCSVRHVRKLVERDEIPFSRVGRLVRFSPVRLSEWLQKGGTR